MNLYLLSALFQHLSSPRRQKLHCQNGWLWKVQSQSKDRMVMTIRMQHKRSWSIYSSEALLFSCDEQLISSSWIKTSILISFIAILFIFIFTIQKPSALFLMYTFDKLWREMLSCCHRIIIFLGINTVNFCAKMFFFFIFCFIYNQSDTRYLILFKCHLGSWFSFC